MMKIKQILSSIRDNWSIRPILSGFIVVLPILKQFGLRDPLMEPIPLRIGVSGF